MRTAHKDLSSKQEMALELVICGMNDGDIAKRAGISRQTVNTWRNHDENFRMLLAERREAARERHRDELSGLVSEAIGVMREAIRGAICSQGCGQRMRCFACWDCRQLCRRKNSHLAKRSSMSSSAT